MVHYTLYEIAFFLFIYAFAGWAVEVAYHSIRDGRFVNRGLLSMPLHLPCGVMFALLIQVLPTLGRNFAAQLLAVFAIMTVVGSVSSVFSRRVSRIALWERAMPLTGSGKSWARTLAMAAGVLLLYHIVHPVLLIGMSVLPRLAVRIAVWALCALLAADFASMLYAVRHGRELRGRAENRSRVQQLADRMSRHIWRRLERAYPDIEADARGEGADIFARGICLDKLVWVFLVCALLGDIIETFYCGLVDGEWMNRSSVLYGPFSFVWGMGAVLLTVTLHRLAGRSDRHVFAGGFIIGGAYEYLCSVMTELVFGTVFWDYSDMPLNIGGRTNVLFCFFWGLLAVVWVKVLYPPMERGIEKIPPLPGKIATWAVVFLMVCNGLLTGAAMLRYNTRVAYPEPRGLVESLLDDMYDDAYVERRWPNMIVTGNSAD